MTDRESLVDSTIVKLKAKEIYGQLTRVRKMLNFSGLVLAGTVKGGTV